MKKYLFIIITGFFLLITHLFPGDVPWINDEPKLLINAYKSNLNHELASHGIIGSFGVKYGPVVTWFYQLILLFTHNLIRVVFIKIFISSLLLFIILYNIFKELKINKYFSLLPFLSPYIYFYNRILWDNCFLLQGTALLTLLYIKFLNTKKIIYFLTIILFSILLINIHPLALLLIVSIIITLFLFEFAWCKKQIILFILSLTIIFIFVFPYFTKINKTSTQLINYKIINIQKIIDVIFGVKIFSFIGFANRFFPEILTDNFILYSYLTDILILLTFIIFIFFAIGLAKYLMILKDWKNILNKSSVRNKIEFLFFICMLISICFFSLLNRRVQPHYLNAIWLVYLFFICKGIQYVVSFKIGLVALKIYIISMVVLLCSFIIFVHINGGNRRVTYGATLKNQIDIAKKIHHFSPAAKLKVNVRNYKYFPYALKILLYFTYYNSSIPDKQHVSTLIIDYKEKKYTGWIDIKQKK